MKSETASRDGLPWYAGACSHRLCPFFWSFPVYLANSWGLKKVHPENQAPHSQQRSDNSTEWHAMLWVLWIFWIHYRKIRVLSIRADLWDNILLLGVTVNTCAEVTMLLLQPCCDAHWYVCCPYLAVLYCLIYRQAVVSLVQLRGLTHHAHRLLVNQTEEF